MKDNDYIKFRDFSTKLVNSVTEQLKELILKIEVNLGYSRLTD